MVDIALFAELLDELANYYGRNITPFIKKTWYKAVGAALTNEEFVEAVEKAICKEQYMPTPEKLLESVKGSSEVLAHSEWELCVKAAARNDREMLSRLSPQGRNAFQLVGGLHKLGMATEEQLTWIKKSFVALWKSTKADAKSLPAARNSEPIMLGAINDVAQGKSMNGKKDKPE